MRTETSEPWPHSLQDGSALWNEDLAPTPPEKRTWNLWHVASLWVGMAVCIPTYMLAADMIAKGMSVAQAILTVSVGNLIVLVPMLLNAHAGTAYGIPFPVFSRASFGVLGANVPAIARAFVACGWFGIQTWIGGGSIHVILTRLGMVPEAMAPIPFLGISATQLACFLAFWVLNVFFIWRGMNSIKWLETLAAPFLLVAGIGLLAWARLKAGGFGAMMDQPGLHGSAFWSTFWPFLTGMVGFWATLALNIPDFSRYCRSQKDQVIGQAIGLPTTMTLVSFIGAAVTSATPLIFGELIWDPNVVVGKFSSPGVVALGLLGISVATLSTNIAANVVSPANDFSNLAPRVISYRLGGFITAAIGLVILPWKLMKGYVFVWLNGYGALLGPIGGILACDYWLVRKRKLLVADLYRRGGLYEYMGGVNPWAIVALLVGMAPNLPGFLHAVGAWTSAPSFFVGLYAYTWFVGFALAGIVYTLLMHVAPLGVQGAVTAADRSSATGV
ncbi:MAG: NCS1 family nucleobase:cation symporter-1 [Deltaproteobacteria bacterium]|nr:NCS1 family nucleobase:cation symporter-1 [Deltaproteobacteria bacterium]